MVAGLTGYSGWNVSGESSGLVTKTDAGKFQLTPQGKEKAKNIVYTLVLKKLKDEEENSNITKNEQKIGENSDVENDEKKSDTGHTESLLGIDNTSELSFNKRSEELFENNGISQAVSELLVIAEESLLNDWERDYQQKEMNKTTIRTISHVSRIPLYLLAVAVQVVKIFFKAIFLMIPTEIYDCATRRHVGNIIGFAGIKMDMAITIGLGIRILDSCFAPEKDVSFLQTCEGICKTIIWEVAQSTDGEILIMPNGQTTTQKFTISMAVSKIWNHSFPKAERVNNDKKIIEEAPKTSNNTSKGDDNKGIDPFASVPEKLRLAYSNYVKYRNEYIYGSLELAKKLNVTAEDITTLDEILIKDVEYFFCKFSSYERGILFQLIDKFSRGDDRSKDSTRRVVTLKNLAEIRDQAESEKKNTYNGVPLKSPKEVLSLFITLAEEMEIFQKFKIIRLLVNQKPSLSLQLAEHSLLDIPFSDSDEYNSSLVEG